MEKILTKLFQALSSFLSTNKPEEPTLQRSPEEEEALKQLLAYALLNCVYAVEQGQGELLEGYGRTVGQIVQHITTAIGFDPNEIVVLAREIRAKNEAEAAALDGEEKKLPKVGIDVPEEEKELYYEHILKSVNFDPDKGGH